MAEHDNVGTMDVDYEKHVERGFRKNPTTDIIIQCGPEETEYHAHKAVLSQYPELVKKKDDNSLIHLPNERPQSVVALLQAAYTGDYMPPNWLEEGLNVEKLLQEELQLYVLAHHLKIDTLKYDVAEGVHRSIENALGPVGQVPRIPEWLPHFIEMVYTATPPEDTTLRESVITCFKRSDRARQLIKKKVFVRATERIPGLLLELFRVNLSLAPTHYGTEKEDKVVGVPSFPAARKSAPPSEWR